MAETTPTTAAPLRFVESEADGCCDPVTGACAWPGAAATTTTELYETRAEPELHYIAFDE